VRGLIVELTGYGEHTVTDMEAGLEHLKRGTARNVDMMLIVVEPYYRSLEAGMRTFKLARELSIPHLYAVPNKIKNDNDQEAIETFCSQNGMPIIASIPDDENLIEAERAAKAPIDFNPEAPSVKVIRSVANRIVELERMTA
jgi:CO dehydrogenase maturation factor